MFPPPAEVARRARRRPTTSFVAVSVAITLASLIGGAGCSSDAGSTTGSGSPSAGNQAGLGSFEDDPERSSPVAPGAGKKKTGPSSPPQSIPVTAGPNLIVNGSFEGDAGPTVNPKSWQIEGAEKVMASVGRHGRDRDGDLHLTQWKQSGPFDVTTAQTVSNLKQGSYVAWLWVRAGGEGLSGTFSVTGTGGADPSVETVQGAVEDWTIVRLGPFPVNSGSATVKIHSAGQAKAWVYVDDVHLHLAGA